MASVLDELNTSIASRRKRIDFRLANPSAPESAVPPVQGEAFQMRYPNGRAQIPLGTIRATEQRNALESQRTPGFQGFTLFTDGPQTAQQREFANPESRFRLINQTGLTNQERMRRREGFQQQDQAAAGRANALDLVRTDNQGKATVAGIQATGSIIDRILGGGLGKNGARSMDGGGVNPLDSLKLAREMGFRNPTELAQDERTQREGARKNVLDMLGRDFGQVYPAAPTYDGNGQLVQTKPGPYTMDDYTRDVYTGGTGRRAPVPRMEAILDDINAQFQAANGRPYFVRPTEKPQGMGDLKANPDATPQGLSQPAASSQATGFQGAASPYGLGQPNIPVSGTPMPKEPPAAFVQKLRALDADPATRAAARAQFDKRFGAGSAENWLNQPR